MIRHKPVCTRRAIDCLVALVLFASTGAIGLSQAPPTIAEELQRHHIGLTQSALIAALNNEDGVVRGLAAGQLAEMKAAVAIPFIIQALRKESDPQTRMNLASAAMWLGSTEGREELETICKDPNMTSTIRLRAARNTFDDNDHTCLPDVISMMRNGNDVDGQIGALEAASQFKARTSAESQEILRSTLDALDSPNVRVRLEVANSIRWLKDPAAVSRLRQAILHESDDAVRTQLASALNVLLSPDRELNR